MFASSMAGTMVGQGWVVQEPVTVVIVNITRAGWCHIAISQGYTRHE